MEVPSAYVLRVESLFGGKRAKSSVDKILAGIRAGQPVRVFADRTVSPSYVDDVVDATDKLLVAGIAPGLYHCVNDGSGTWLDIAVELTRLLGREADIVPVSVNDVKLTAKRPRYCALANDKLRMASITDANVAGCPATLRPRDARRVVPSHSPACPGLSYTFLPLTSGASTTPTPVVLPWHAC